MRKTKAKIKKKKNRFGFTPAYLMILILLGAVALVVIIAQIDTPYQQNNNKVIPEKVYKELVKEGSFSKFKSAEDFKSYLDSIDENSYYGLGLTRAVAAPQLAATDDMVAEEFALGNSVDLGTGGAKTVDRVSGTNVQVMGIDEPDIVKTDGSQIYFSDNIARYWIEEPIMFDDVSVDSVAPYPYVDETKTNVINAWPPSDLELSSEIDLTGDLLLVDNMLLVFSGRDITAYDISDPKNPTEKWQVELDERTYLVTSRLYDDQVYLVTQTTLNRYSPCPITPLRTLQNGLTIPCTSVYHPNGHDYVDSTFTVISLDPQSGNFDDEISFVGSQSTTNIYMSTNALYLAYTQNIDMFDFLFDFITNELSDLAPSSLVNRLKQVNAYDISNQSKLVELQTMLEEWMQSLDRDEMLRVETEMTNRSEDYYEKNKRYFVTTALVKVGIDDLDIKATGIIPGYLLNQFSMDEYENHLRVATTIGDRWGWGNRTNQVNDVYVLDDKLKITGAVTDLGESERIYSVRFIKDLAYVVTFRQTDPFYVLDLSNVNSPKMVGELKIPGYSSYLHPISENRILGIGMENGQVKLSYFDVSNPNNPQEIDKYSLSEYGSEALYNHHAFLQDAKHQVFFLPSYKGGYIFSYANDKLELARTLSVPDVKRALYLNDYMYILADNYIAVLNENDWEKVNELDL